MSREIKFVNTGGPYGDACCGYDVIGCEGMTVKEFINHILNANPNEWGYFETPFTTLEYRYGKLLSLIPAFFETQRISKVTANGGWSRMDYKIDY